MRLLQMKLEIERKFLLKDQSWKAGVVGVRTLSDGLLSSHNGNKTRARCDDARGLITIKGPKAGFSRVEYEFEIPLADAQYMLANLCGANVCRKIRYTVLDAGNIWYVDVYEDVLEGFVIAEIEIADENEVFSLPLWIGPEVTGNHHYGKWVTLARLTAVAEARKSERVKLVQPKAPGFLADVLA